MMPDRLRRFVQAEWPLGVGELETASEGATPEQAQWWRRLLAWRNYQRARREWLKAKGSEWRELHGVSLIDEFRSRPPGEYPAGSG